MKIKEIFQSLIGKLSGPLGSNVHDGKLTANARFPETLRYPSTVPTPGASNQHGEFERFSDGTEVNHWFAESVGVRWHFVTAGNPANEPVLMIHGLPESWYAFHHQIAALADEFYVVAIDMKGYGQSDKRRGLDYSNATMAHELAQFIDTIGLQSFNMVAHDRGTVLADYLCEVEGMSARILRYVRMQQSGSEPHSYPRPPHKLFASRVGAWLFARKGFVRSVYNSKYVAHPLSAEAIKRLDYEFKYRGVAAAVADNFKTTNFDFELQERHDRLFKCMTMPVLFLQGSLDPGQKPSEYVDVTSHVEQGSLQFIEASHFLHLERPAEVSSAIRNFLQDVAVA